MKKPKIPKNWNKVTIGGYNAFLKSVNSEEEETPVSSIIDTQIMRVCYLTGCQPEEAELCTTPEYAKVQNLVKQPLPQQLKHFQFKLKGIRYKLLFQSKDLTGKRIKAIKTLDARKMNAGQYAAHMNVAKRGYLDNLHQVMFNLCQPMRFVFKKSFPFIGWKPYEFEPQEVEQRIAEFKELTMDIVNPAAVFFCKVSKKLTNVLEESLMENLEKMNKKLEKAQADLLEYSDGS